MWMSRDLSPSQGDNISILLFVSSLLAVCHLIKSSASLLLVLLFLLLLHFGFIYLVFMVDFIWVLSAALRGLFGRKFITAVSLFFFSKLTPRFPYESKLKGKQARQIKEKKKTSSQRICGDFALCPKIIILLIKNIY